MNTPSSKQPVRGGPPKDWGKDFDHPDGQYVGALTNPDLLTYLAYFISDYGHLEEHMVDVLASLMSENIHNAKRDANVIFRSIVNARDRIKVMRNLLQESTNNKLKSSFYDDVINQFSSLTATRNEYVHGLWWTHNETQRVFLVSPEPSYFPAFFSRREINDNELKNNINRLRELDMRILRELHLQHKNALLHTQVGPTRGTQNE